MFVQASEAARLAGITEHQLKEWCIRRALLAPDVPPKGRGHVALFGWQTLLALRLLSEIHKHFGGTITHWGPVLSKWRRQLERTPFHSLAGNVAVFETAGTRLVRDSRIKNEKSSLAIALDPHLNVLARGLSRTDPELRLPLPPVLVRR